MLSWCTGPRKLEGSLSLSEVQEDENLTQEVGSTQRVAKRVFSIRISNVTVIALLLAVIAKLLSESFKCHSCLSVLPLHPACEPCDMCRSEQVLHLAPRMLETMH